MPKTANTYDTFTAIAEPKRRQLIEVLIGNEMNVGELVETTQWNQPVVSKHLGVLKAAGLVSERREGRQRIYRVNAQELQPIQLWIKQFEKYWNQQFDQLDAYLNQLQNKGDNQ
ncbi:ArsR/SmtB family transcription factor [Pseudoteredinibacter isoporae]|uniref:ArsR/SmtB family transcription factor n=1 Tax=Pseudoteredinibacter isoporae TaxID=570281 RepID=UPI0031070654